MNIFPQIALPADSPSGSGTPTSPAGARRLARNSSPSGFTLIEISMVLLLFASAIGGLLSFFPVGLRLEANAISDSAQTMFALNVLGQIEANANAIDDWSVWEDTGKFCKAAFKDIEVGGDSLSVGTLKKRASRAREGKNEDLYHTDYHAEYENSGLLIKEYLGSKSANMRYVLQVSPVETPVGYGDNGKDHRLRRIVLWVTDRRDGDPFMNTPFTLDLVFHPSLDGILKGGA